MRYRFSKRFAPATARLLINGNTYRSDLALRCHGVQRKACVFFHSRIDGCIEVFKGCGFRRAACAATSMAAFFCRRKGTRLENWEEHEFPWCRPDVENMPALQRLRTALGSQETFQQPVRRRKEVFDNPLTRRRHRDSDSYLASASFTLASSASEGARSRSSPICDNALSIPA